MALFEVGNITVIERDSKVISQYTDFKDYYAERIGDIDLDESLFPDGTVTLKSVREIIDLINKKFNTRIDIDDEFLSFMEFNVGNDEHYMVQIGFEAPFIGFIPFILIDEITD